MYLDFAEDQARRKKPMHMADWVGKLEAFLQFNGRNILTHAGTVSHQLAEDHAHAGIRPPRCEIRYSGKVIVNRSTEFVAQQVARALLETIGWPSRSRGEVEMALYGVTRVSL